MSTKFLPVRDMCYVAIFTAMIIVLSQIQIPMPVGVPMTMQTFVIPLAGVVLGAKRGGLSVLAYILLGAVGLPVFVGSTGFVGGIGVLLGMTGGFLFGFPLYAYAAGFGADRGRPVFLALGLLVGMVLTYTLGMVQFALVTGSSLQTAFFAVVWLFLPTEAIKLLFVWILGPKIRSRLSEIGV